MPLGNLIDLVGALSSGKIQVGDARNFLDGWGGAIALTGTNSGGVPSEELPNPSIQDPRITAEQVWNNPDLTEAQKTTTLRGLMENFGLDYEGFGSLLGIPGNVVEDWFNKNTPEDSYDIVDMPTGYEGEYTDSNGVVWGVNDSTGTRWVISDPTTEAGGGGGSEAGAEEQGASTEDIMGTEDPFGDSTDPAPYEPWPTDDEGNRQTTDLPEGWVYPNERLPGNTTNWVDFRVHYNPDGSEVFVYTDDKGNTYEKWGEYGEDAVPTEEIPPTTEREITAQDIRVWWENNPRSREEVIEAGERNNVPIEVLMRTIPEVFTPQPNPDYTGDPAPETGVDKTGIDIADTGGNGNGDGDGDGDGDGNGDGDGDGGGNGIGAGKAALLLSLFSGATPIADELFKNTFKFENKIKPVSEFNTSPLIKQLREQF